MNSKKEKSKKKRNEIVRSRSRRERANTITANGEMPKRLNGPDGQPAREPSANSGKESLLFHRHDAQVVQPIANRASAEHVRRP
jgi:hypothetical protein